MEIPLDEFLKKVEDGVFSDGYMFTIDIKDNMSFRWLKYNPLQPSNKACVLGKFIWLGIIVNKKLIQLNHKYKPEYINCINYSYYGGNYIKQYLKLSIEKRQDLVNRLRRKMSACPEYLGFYISYDTQPPFIGLSSWNNDFQRKDGNEIKWFHTINLDDSGRKSNSYPANDMVVKGSDWCLKKDLYQFAVRSYVVIQKNRDTPAAKQAFGNRDILSNIASFLYQGDGNVIDHGETAKRQLTRLRQQRNKTMKKQFELMEQMKQLDNEHKQMTEVIEHLDEYLHYSTLRKVHDEESDRAGTQRVKEQSNKEQAQKKCYLYVNN